MSVKIYPSQYKDQNAISIESSLILAQFLPGIGAKLSSLVYKPRNLELLVHRPDPKYRIAPYDGDYVAQGECSGLDDMFPSIDRCYYERFPWQGTLIPDHGEVWSLPWECRIESDRLHFSVHGVRFPYQLEKWVSLRDEGALHIDYRVTNLSGFDFDFLWAAHPMFVLEEGAQVRLPGGVHHIVTAFSATGSMGKYGEVLDWPDATLPGGQTLDLSRMRPASVRQASKYYIKGKLPEGWCTLTYPKSMLDLTLSFPVESVPYLSLLPNEGGWQDLYMIFIEPATASFDRIDAARLRGEYSTVKAHSTYAWYLELGVEESEE